MKLNQLYRQQQLKKDNYILTADGSTTFATTIQNLSSFITSNIKTEIDYPTIDSNISQLTRQLDSISDKINGGNI